MKYLKSLQARDNAFKTIERLALLNGITPEEVAEDIVKTRRADISAHVIKNNIVPAENAGALALQTMLLHDSNVMDKQRAGIPDYDRAEAAVLQDQIEQEENGVDNFIGGSLMASIMKAGDSALNKVNKQRIKKGKRPILSGKLIEKIRKGVRLSDDEKQIIFAAKLPDDKPKPKTDSEMAAAIEGINESLTNDGKKDFLKENKILIIAAIAAVIYLLSNQK